MATTIYQLENKVTNVFPDPVSGITLSNILLAAYGSNQVTRMICKDNGSYDPRP